MQGLPGLPGPSGLTYIDNVITYPSNLSLPFKAIGATIGKNTIYLNSPSSYYSISLSLNNLGDAYIPNAADPVNGIGSWNVNNILAGTPSDTSVADNIFGLSQRPVMFFIQNVGAVPIQINFNTNDGPEGLVYFSFGVPPNQTPSSFILQPMDILIFQAVFTSNNVIRLYNSFLDSLDYNQMFRTLDQALSFGYYEDTSTLSSSLIGSGTFFNILEAVNTGEPGTTASYQIILSEIVPYFSENNILIEAINGPITLLIDGTGIPSNTVIMLLLLTPNANYDATITYKNLVGIKNYLGTLPPDTVIPNQVWYILIKGTTVTGYDKRYVNFDNLPKIVASNIGLHPL